MKSLWKRFLLLAMLLVLGPGAIKVQAKDMLTFGVTVEYGQTEARKQLDMVNELRTGSEAWYWNEDNTTKTVYSAKNGNALQPLVYDYELEKVAMLRAAEIALSYSHDRLNGKTTRELFDRNAAGENIAAGYRTTEAVFVGWREDDELYAGQGHRRNMLNPNFKSMATGHVYYNGYHYWVQLFRAPAGSMSATAANDSEETVSVETLSTAIQEQSVTASVSSLTIPYGLSVALPDVEMKVSFEKTWPGELCKVEFPYTYSVADASIISISDGKVTGKKCGSTSLTVTVPDLGETLTIPVTVEPLSIASATVSLESETYTYDGEAKAPSVSSVVLNGSTLANTDYTVSYSNNISAGTATVTVTGKGNYTGTVNKTFTIVAADIKGAVVDNIADEVYSGAAIETKVTVTYGAKILISNTDYTVSYSNNTNAGTATVTITGKGNYKGTSSITFTINPADIKNTTVGEIATQTYSGSAIKPKVKITYGTKTLTSGTDYTVSYSDNTDIGTATVTITGMGNYSGTVTKTFKIVAATSPATEPEFKDSKTGAYYKVTKKDTSKTAAVQYVKPVSKTKKTVTIPDTIMVEGVTYKVTSIAANAFANNKKLQKLTISKNVASVGSKAFYNCKKLKTITIKTSKLTSRKVGANAFKGIHSKATIKVPAKKLTAYQKILKAKGIGAKVKVKK